MLNLIAVLSLEELMEVCEAFRAEVESRSSDMFAEINYEENDDQEEGSNEKKDQIVQAEEFHGVKPRVFERLLLPVVVNALIRNGFEVPIDEEIPSPTSNSASTSPSFLSALANSPASKRQTLQHQRIAKIAQRELRELFRTIDVKQKGQIDWTDLLRYFVDEIDRRSTGAEQGGLSGERLSSKFSAGGVGETLSFDQASAGSHSIYSVAHVLNTPDRRASEVSLFIPEWSAYLFGVTEAGKQGFELVDAATLQTVRLGFHSSSDNASHHDKLASILHAVAIPKYSLIAACHHDSTVTFWSFPTSISSMSSSTNNEHSPSSSSSDQYHHHQAVLLNNNVKKFMSETSSNAARSSIVCFKKIAPIDTPEHVRVFEWNNESSTLFSGSSNGVLRKWTIISSSSATERHAPDLKEFVQAHTSNITQILSCGPNRVVTTSMDRSVCVIDTSKMKVLDRRGGRSINGVRGGQNHSQGILSACIVEHDRNEVVVATAGFDGDILIWTLYPTGVNSHSNDRYSKFDSSVAFSTAATKPTRIQDPSNPHRGAIHYISKLTNSAANMHSHLLISGDSVGIVKIWDTIRGVCIQSVQACRLGDDDPPPPIIISNSSLSALVTARKNQQELLDADNMMSAQTRRVFKGTSAPSGQQRHFIYSVDLKTSAFFATGPRSSYLFRGHVPRNPDRADDFSVLAAVQLPDVGCLLSLHHDCAKIWNLGSGALTSVHSMSRANLTCVSVDRHSRCYFVGDSKGIVSCHSTYSGSIACKWKVFPNGDPILNLRSLRRRDGTHLLFAISDVGGVAVTQTDEDFYDRQLQKESVLEKTEEKTKSYDNNSNAENILNNTNKHTNKTGKNDNKSSPQEDDSRERKIHHLNAVITRNIAVLQRHITATGQEDPNTIPVSLDGRVDQNLTKSASSLLVRTGSKISRAAPKRNMSFISRAKLRHQPKKTHHHNNNNNTHSLATTPVSSRTGYRTASSSNGSSNNNNTNGASKQSQRSIIYQQQSELNNEEIQKYEDEVDFLTIVAYEEVSLVVFVAGSIVLCIDLQSLEIVHAFHSGCNRRIVAVSDMGACGALCIIDDQCLMSVFGVRPSHVANQILAIRDLSRAHPSKHWVRNQKENGNNDNNNNNNNNNNNRRFQTALITCATFQQHTCSMLVGDEDGGISSWSLRELKKHLRLRSVQCYPPRSQLNAKMQAKELRQLEHVRPPPDLDHFGEQTIVFEFRRGPGRSLEKIAQKRKKKSSTSEEKNQHHQTMKKQQQDQSSAIVMEGGIVVSIPQLSVVDNDDDHQTNENESALLNDDDNEFLGASIILPATAGASLHNMRTALKLPLADKADDENEEDADEDLFCDRDSQEKQQQAFSDKYFGTSTNKRRGNSTSSTSLTAEEVQQQEMERRGAIINPLGGGNRSAGALLGGNGSGSGNHHHHGLDGDTETAAVEIGVLELISLEQIGNKVGFLSVGSSDCRVVLLDRNLSIHGELQQSRTRDKIDQEEFIGTEEKRKLITSNKNKKKEDHKNMNGFSGKKNGQEVGTIPWNYYELKEEVASFIDPVADLTDGVIHRLQKFIHDVRFRLAYSKTSMAWNLSPSSSSSSATRIEQKKQEQDRQKLLVDAGKQLTFLTSVNPVDMIMKSSGAKKTDNETASSKLLLSRKRSKTSFILDTSTGNLHDQESLLLTSTSRSESRISNTSCSNHNPQSSIQDAFGRQFHDTHSDLDDDDRFPVHSYSPMPKHKMSLNPHHHQTIENSSPSASPSKEEGLLSITTSTKHKNIDHHHHSPSSSSKNKKQKDHDNNNFPYSSPTNHNSNNRNHQHQHYQSLYHNVTSPPSSLQRRRFQLNSRVTVTLPPLEMDFKEVLKESEEAWKTGKSQDVKTFSPESKSLNSNNNNDFYSSSSSPSSSTSTMSENKSANRIFKMIASSSPSSSSRDNNSTNYNNGNNHNSPRTFLAPLSDFATSSSSLTARSPPSLSTKQKNQQQEVSTRQDKTMKHRIGEGVSPSLGLTGDEIVRIRETSRSSRELLTGFAKMRLAPPTEDIKLPSSARTLNLPPMKL